MPTTYPGNTSIEGLTPLTGTGSYTRDGWTEPLGWAHAPSHKQKILAACAAIQPINGKINAVISALKA